MRRVIFNQKGGVGKTTVTCNLAAINAASGRRTLVVDLDPQANASHYLTGTNPEGFPSHLAGFFEQHLGVRRMRRGIADFVQPTRISNLDLLPAHPDLELIQDKLTNRHKIYKLREALDSLAADYQDVFIDTPPALNFYSRSALIAADRCIIPFDCDAFARRALYTLMDNIDELRDDHNDRLEVEGILVNNYDPRTSLSNQLIRELEQEGLPILRSRLSAAIKVRESHQLSRPLIDLAPAHKLCAELKALHRELDQRSPSVPVIRSWAEPVPLKA